MFQSMIGKIVATIGGKIVSELLKRFVDRIKFHNAFFDAAASLLEHKYRNYSSFNELSGVVFAKKRICILANDAYDVPIEDLYSTIKSSFQSILNSQTLDKSIDKSQLADDYFQACICFLKDYNKELIAICGLLEDMHQCQSDIESLEGMMNGVIKHINEMERDAWLDDLLFPPDINRYLKSVSKSKMPKPLDLDFYYYDDKELADYLNDVAPGKRLAVNGTFVEETKYTVCAQLLRLGYIPVVIEKHDAWNKILSYESTDLSHYVFINGFVSEELAFPNSDRYKYVQVLSKKGPTKDVFQLRNQMRSTVVEKLQKYKMDLGDAWRIIDNNNNQYGLYKRELMDISQDNPFEKHGFDEVLLIGLALTNRVVDMDDEVENKNASLEFLNRITQGNYVIADLNKLARNTKSNNMVGIIKRTEWFGTHFFTPASLNLTWDYLLNYAEDLKRESVFVRFADVFLDLLFDTSHYHQPSNDQVRFSLDSLFWLSVSGDSGDFFPSLSRRIFSRLENDKDNVLHDQVAPYLRDIAEIAPGETLKFLEKEMAETQASNIKTGFYRYFVSGNNAYPSVLSCFDVFRCHKQLKHRVGPLLFRLYCICNEKLAYSNNPLGSLDALYMAYCQNSFLTEDEKAEQISIFLKDNHRKAFDLLQRLQYSFFSKTWYVDPYAADVNIRFESYSDEQRQSLFLKYAKMLVDNLESEEDVKVAVESPLIFLKRDLFELFLDKLADIVRTAGDVEKASIYEILLKSIHKARYFGDRHSLFGHEQELESFIDFIIFEEPIYKYLYFFHYTIFSMPLLHPISYQDSDAHEKNEKEAERAFEEACTIVADNKCSLTPLLEDKKRNRDSFSDENLIFLLAKCEDQYKDQGLFDYVYRFGNADKEMIKQYAYHVRKDNPSFADHLDEALYCVKHDDPESLAVLLETFEIDLQDSDQQNFFANNHNLLAAGLFKNGHHVFFATNKETFYGLCDGFAEEKNYSAILTLCEHLRFEKGDFFEWIIMVVRKYGSSLRGTENADKASLHDLFEYLASRRERVYEMNDDDLIGELSLMEIHVFLAPFDGRLLRTVFTNGYMTKRPDVFASFVSSRWGKKPKNFSLDGDLSLDDSIHFHLYVPFFPDVPEQEFKSWMDRMFTLFDDSFLAHQALAKIYCSAPLDSSNCPSSCVLEYFEPMLSDTNLAVEILCKLQNADNAHAVDGIALSLKAKYYSDIYEKLKDKYPNISRVYQQIANDMLRWNENEKESLR